MNNQEAKNEPTFIDQAFAIVELNYDSKNGHNMTLADHKMLCLLLSAHEKYIYDKIVASFVAQVAEYHEPVMLLIKSLEERLCAEEKKNVENEKWKERKRLRIEKLETDMALYQPESVIEIKRTEVVINEIKPSLEKVANFLDWWTWKNWIKIVGIIILFIGLICGVVWLSHRIGLVSQSSLRKNQSYDVTWTPEYQLKVQNAPTRAIHANKLTVVQEDSVIEVNQRAIDRSIEERNKVK